VELEDREVEAPALDDADADEAVHDLRELRVLAAGNLPVDRAAGFSRDAAEDDHQGFAGAGGFGDARVEVVVDPGPREGVVAERVAQLLLVARGEEQEPGEAEESRLHPA